MSTPGMVNRHQHVEHAVLGLVLNHSDPQGYPLSIGTLTQILRERLADAIPDLNQREIVEALERLSDQYLAITKHSSGRWKRYPDEVVGDLVFFRGDFRLQRTAYTGPRMEELAQKINPWESAVATPISEAGRQARFEQWEKMGLDRVKGDLLYNGGRNIGSHQIQELAWEWVRMKEAQAAATTTTKTPEATVALIAKSRINDLHKLSSSKFDFSKLIRLCEEINIAYGEGCFLATAMLTRSLLDHVPPIFGNGNFDEVVNHYGSKSFKDTMRHLNEASRSVADGHLHEQIGRRVALPTAQQVDCRQQLDALLAEILKVSG